jgi:thioredoxin-related protein
MNLPPFFLCIAGLILLAACASSQQATMPRQSLNHYQFEQLDSLQQVESRPVAVFLHAPWCRYCRNMEQTTFAHPGVVSVLNEQYYFVSFNGESKAPVHFREHTFRFLPNGRNSGTHELAQALGATEGQLVYPTFLILDENYEVVFQHNAFLSATDMQRLLQEPLKD